MNTTVRIKASQIYKDWHVIDAAGRPLGRVATEAAILLRGKHKPTYEPHLDDGDFVVVINASLVRVTGRKSAQIKYYTHSGYPGGLKTRSYDEQMASHPERILEKAIWGMLPGGPLGEAMFRHLKVYKGSNHPHQSQITGSERAREARPAVTAPGPAKPARLRPLSVPDVAPEPVARVVAAPKVAAEKPAARKPKPAARKPKAPSEAVAAKAAEAPVAVAAAEPVTAVVKPAPAETAVKKPAAPRKKAVAATAPAEAEVKKPAAPRKKAAEATASGEAEAKKPAAPRKKAVAATAEASPEAAVEEKKPARRRAAKTEE